MIAVEVAARHENELLLEDSLLFKPCVRLNHGLGDMDTAVDLFLRDPRQFRAKRGQLGVKDGLDVALKGGDDGFLAHVDEYDRVLNHLLAVHLDRLVVVASALKVKDAEVLERGLVREDTARSIEDVAEIVRGDAAICKTLRQDNSILGDPEGQGWLSVHGLCDIDLDDDLAGGSHARDHSFVLWQSNGQVDVIAGHLV